MVGVKSACDTRASVSRGVGYSSGFEKTSGMRVACSYIMKFFWIWPPWLVPI